MNKLKKNIPAIINTILLGLLFGSILIITDNIKIQKGQLDLLIITGMLTLVLSDCMQTILHEAGHLVFGLLSGYKFVSFRIGNIMLIKINNKIKLKKFSLLGTAGQCLMEPPKLINNKMPVILYNYGGVIMNILTSVIAIIISSIINDTLLLKYSLQLFSIVGIYYALLNGIPLKAQINNDGLNAILLVKNKNAQKAFWTQLMANAEQTKGKRIKDMPNVWFYLPTEEEMKNNISATIGVLYCSKLIDEHKFKETKENIIKVLKHKETIAYVHTHLLKVDQTYCELLEGNIENANKLLTEAQKKFMKAMKSFPSVIRTEYAIAKILEKDDKKCIELLKYFEKIKKNYPYKADIETEEELINIIKNKTTKKELEK